MSRSNTRSSSNAHDEFLALENASVRLGESIVFGGTHWTWRFGEQWSIMGPENAGKSLLIEVLLGRVPLGEGDIRGPHPLRRRKENESTEIIAHVSPHTQRQLALTESSFYQSRWHSGVHEGQRTVAQFLSQESVEERNPFEVGGSQGNRRGFLRRQRKLVDGLGIRRLMSRKLIHLSNGELRKTLLVHALLKSPRLLILEDPFAGLDASTRRLLHRVINRVMREGMPVLVATNRLEDIPQATTHLLVLDEHRVIAQGTNVEMRRLWRKRFGSQRARMNLQAARAQKLGAAKPRPETGAPLVEFQHVHAKSGRQPILRDVTWTLRAGECWALSGPNGAGKTTLLNLIQGDHPQAYSQNIRLFGRNLDSTKALWQTRQQIGGLSPELHQHYPGEWQVQDVVCSGFFNTIGLYTSCSRAQRHAARQWLIDLGLGTQARESFAELNFSQQRMVLLARAAVKRPRLLILDEACQGLDATQSAALLAIVNRIVARTGAGLIFVTHHAKEIPKCITHVLRLRQGAVTEARALPRANSRSA